MRFLNWERRENEKKKEDRRGQKRKELRGESRRKNKSEKWVLLISLPQKL